MKRIKLSLIIFFFICFFPLVTNAATSLSVSTQSPVVGSSIYVQLNIDYGHDVKISEAHYAISFGSDNYILEDIIWTQSPGTYRREGGTIYIDKPNNGSPWEYGGQVQLKLKVNRSGVNKIDIRENGVAKYLDGSIVSQTYSGVTISATEANTDSTIGSLYIEGYAISPTFNKNTYTYSLKVPSDVNSVNVVAKKGNTKQNITGDGTRNLVYGDNRIRVIVTAESGSERLYEIMVTREDNRTGDASLKSLSVSNTDIKYDSKLDTYTAIVGRSTDSVLITARTEDPNASLTGIGTKSLQIGTNTFQLKVTTSSGIEKIYTINIVRSEDELQVNVASNNLINLKINNTNINLKENITTYLYGVNNTIDTADISYVTKSKTAKVEIEQNDKLSVGINTITIKVSDEEVEDKTYRVLIYKPSKNNTIVSDFSNITNEKNIEYNASETEEHTIPPLYYDNLKDVKNLIYNVVNDYNGILYQIKLNNKQFNKNIDFSFTKTNNVPLTYETNLEDNIEIMLYVGDVFVDNLNLKVYTYDEIGHYTLLTDGVTVIDGYVNIITNGAKNYVFTTSPLIKEKSNKTFIIILFIVIITIIVIVFLNKKKPKQKVVDNGPLY